MATTGKHVGRAVLGAVQAQDDLYSSSGWYKLGLGKRIQEQRDRIALLLADNERRRLAAERTVRGG